LEDIIISGRNSSIFEEFYKRSEAEAKSLSSKSSTFISSLKQNDPELFKDLLSTFFPIDPKIIVNLEVLVNHFGMKKVKHFPSLFLATAFFRREVGVTKSVHSPCGGNKIIPKEFKYNTGTNCFHEELFESSSFSLI
jgi:hypothetical protein